MNNHSDIKHVDTREWYDFVGELSETLPGIHLGGEIATRELLSMCGLGPGKHVLDVGCGSGTTACMVAELYGADVTGIDFSPVMIARANERARRKGLDARVTFRTGDAFELPFLDGEFDLGLLESVLTPLPGDKSLVLDELMRVLRPGGLIAINESIFKEGAPPEMESLFLQHPAIFGHFTPDSLRGLVEQAGLQVLHMTVSDSGDIPSAVDRLGVGGIMRFMVTVYPKVLWKLLRDRRFREASRVDGRVTKLGKDYMGYALLVGRKPA